MMDAALRVLLNGYDRLVLYLGLAWLGVLCLAWTSIAMIIYPLLSARRGRSLGRYVIMAVFRIYLASLSMSRRCSFDLKALDVLRDEPSLIIAPNHPCMLDAVMMISRLPNIACVLKADLMNNIFLGAGSRLARYIRNEPVRRMAQLAVQTVLIETDSEYLSKGWPLFRKPPMPIHYRVRLGRRFDPPQHTRRFMAELEHYFAHELVRGSAFYPTGSLPTQAERTPEVVSRSTS